MTTDQNTGSAELLETWLKQHPHFDTPRYKALVRVVAEQDRLCERCLPQKALLCPGTRQVFDYEESDAVNAPKLGHLQCPKSQQITQKRERLAMVGNAFQYPGVVHTIRNSDSPLKKVGVTIGNSVKCGDHTLPAFTSSIETAKLLHTLECYMFAAVREGYQPSMINAVALSKLGVHDQTGAISLLTHAEPFIEFFGNTVDWLVIRNFELLFQYTSRSVSSDRQFISMSPAAFLQHVIIQRVAQKKPTTLLTSNGTIPQPSTPQEKQLSDYFALWPTIQLP